jgi:hypothetical protein
MNTATPKLGARSGYDASGARSQLSGSWRDNSAGRGRRRYHFQSRRGASRNIAGQTAASLELIPKGTTDLIVGAGKDARFAGVQAVFGLLSSLSE